MTAFLKVDLSIEVCPVSLRCVAFTQLSQLNMNLILYVFNMSDFVTYFLDVKFQVLSGKIIMW